jgi:hypothetical protein
VSQITKHTIEVEVTWDAFDDYTTPHRVGGKGVSEDFLKSLGITRPEPPYEPQVGDVVEYQGYWCQVQRLGGPNAKRGIDPHELVGPSGSVLFVSPIEKLVLVARPARPGVFVARPRVKP